ncbi:MAG: RbsD/FucU family protein [Abditibacteriota bacterium]|nr:RbsD/FucU family protein [Abditibacteriota bacterium]
MLNNIPKILTGDMLKCLSDMGHGDTLIIADANFPGERIARSTATGVLIRSQGCGASDLFEAISGLLPLDFDYTAYPACVMDLTPSDREKGMADPEIWAEFTATLKGLRPDAGLGLVERQEFYRRAEKAYAVIQTGEERIYGNLLLVKGCVL